MSKLSALSHFSISVDTKASSSDIDWFQLHPSIRCGDRTIAPEEWQKLILGQLLIEDKDGSLIMPQIEGDEGGLEMLAELLRPRRRKPDGSKAKGNDALTSFSPRDAGLDHATQTRRKSYPARGSRKSLFQSFGVQRRG